MREQAGSSVRQSGAAAAITAAVALVAFSMPLTGFSSVTDQFINMGIDTGLQIIQDPGDFLFDVHLVSQDRTPLPVGKAFQGGINLFPNLIPWGQLASSWKAQLHREHGGWPQIDTFFGGWSFVPAWFIKTDDFKGASFWGYHGGLDVSESVDPHLRLFVGYEYTQMRIGATWSKPLKLEEMEISSINVGKSEHFAFVGAELMQAQAKRLVLETGYGLVSSKIMMKVTWSSRNFDTGIVLYPEGACVIWPMWNFQVRF